MELKPCPFCGENEAQLDKTYDEVYGGERFNVVCAACGVMFFKSKLLVNAVKNWNRRAGDTDE